MTPGCLCCCLLQVVCGNRAGAITILLDYNGKAGHKAEDLHGEQRPTHVVQSLLDVVDLLQTHYQVQPATNPHGVVVPMQ